MNSQHLKCQGLIDDLPAIVLEAGGGRTKEDWIVLQGCLAQRTLTVSYDRVEQRTPAEYADDLSAAGVTTRLGALLKDAGIPPPYLMVGHSLGGLFVQYYATIHSNQVAGLVLVDPTPADQSDPLWKQIDKQIDKEYMRWAYPAPIRRALRLWHRNIRLLACKILTPTGLLRIYNPFHVAVRLRAVAWKTRKLVLDNPMPPNIPVLVVSADLPDSEIPLPSFARARAIVHQQHQQTATISQVGRHWVMPHTDHGSIVLDPEHAVTLGKHILDFARAFCRVSK